MFCHRFLQVSYGQRSFYYFSQQYLNIFARKFNAILLQSSILAGGVMVCGIHFFIYFFEAHFVSTNSAKIDLLILSTIFNNPEQIGKSTCIFKCGNFHAWCIR